MLQDYPLLKDCKLFKTSEQVAKFREDLEKGTKEKFKELDRQRIKTWIKAKEIIFC